jgi:hypothetical protein
MFRSRLFMARLFRAGIFGYARVDVPLPPPDDGRWIRLPRDSEVWVRVPRES